MTLYLPWSLGDGGTLKDDKMRSMHQNSIPSDVLSYIRQREHMRKKPNWYFWFNRLWHFNFPIWLSSKIYKSHYLGIFSSDFKNKDRSVKILTNRVHGEKTHFDSLSVIPLEILVTLHLPRGLKLGPWPRRNFQNMG